MGRGQGRRRQPRRGQNRLYQRWPGLLQKLWCTEPAQMFGPALALGLGLGLAPALGLELGLALGLALARTVAALGLGRPLGCLLAAMRGSNRIRTRTPVWSWDDVGLASPTTPGPPHKPRLCYQLPGQIIHWKHHCCQQLQCRIRRGLHNVCSVSEHMPRRQTQPRPPKTQSQPPTPTP